MADHARGVLATKRAAPAPSKLCVVAGNEDHRISARTKYPGQLKVDARNPKVQSPKRGSPVRAFVRSNQSRRRTVVTNHLWVAGPDQYFAEKLVGAIYYRQIELSRRIEMAQDASDPEPPSAALIPRITVGEGEDSGREIGPAIDSLSS